MSPNSVLFTFGMEVLLKDTISRYFQVQCWVENRKSMVLIKYKT